MSANEQDRSRLVPCTRYQYRRSVTISEKGQTYTRVSTLIFTDSSEPWERDILESGKSKVDWSKFYDPQIQTANGTPLNPELLMYGSLWTEKMNRAVRWKGHFYFGKLFYLPMDAEFNDKRVRFIITYSNWKLFRTEVKIIEGE